MFKSFFKSASLVCLLALLFVQTGNASNAGWYCDRYNGTYSIIDFSTYKLDWLTDGLPMSVLLANNPYYIEMPQNIKPGQTMTAHFKAHCVGFNATNAFQLTATAKNGQNQTVASKTLSCKTKNWTSDYTFNVPATTQKFDFTYKQNGNTKAKEVKFWIPMPLHLDARDQIMDGKVEVGETVNFNIPLHTFFVESNHTAITITRIDDENYNYADFAVVKGSVNAAKRCGYHGYISDKFVNTNDAANQFTISFTPSAKGERKCQFLISNGTMQKIITVTAQGVDRYVDFKAFGDGKVELYVNDATEPVTESPYIFSKGDRLRFVATANDCSHFVNWSTAPLNTNTELEVTGNHSFTIQANFAINMYNVSAVSNNDNFGSVSYDQNPLHHYCGATIQFAATPAEGYQFKGWKLCSNPDRLISTDAYYSVDLSGDLCLMAIFEVEGEDDGFRIICEKENGGIDVSFSNPSNVEGIALVYSYNKRNWTDYTIGDTLHVDNKGDVVYLKAKTTNPKICSTAYSYNTVSDLSTLVPAISISDSASVAGNIMYLLDNTCQATTMADYAFTSLFAGDNIVDAQDLILPAETVGSRVYNSMFIGCQTLRSVPELPATVVGNRSYCMMFAYCTSLEAAPALLPADSVALKTYESMFEGCSALTVAPEISATKIGEDGCRMMFRNCTSLETAAEINATQLQVACYQYMYEGCTSLVDAPALPATTLNDRCYSNMFLNCTSLETAPVLPAQTLVKECYQNMFDGCSSLNRIEVAFTGDWDKWKTYNWTRNVAAEGTFVCPEELAKSRNTASAFHYIPTLWDVVNPGQQQNAPRHVEKSVEYIAMGEGMNIIVKGAEDAMVYVYDAAGRMVSSIANASDFETIPVAVPGVYVVVVPGQEPTRVVVK